MNSLHAYNRLHLNVKKNQPHFIKDPIHGSINFSEDQLWLYELVNTEEFQRLHSLRQMHWASLNFPAAVHTRLAHSLGAYELCNRFIKGFLDRHYLDKKNDRLAINIALASALLHDIGHGPLSHAFEHAIGKFNHEDMGVRIILSEDSKINKLLRAKSVEDGQPEDFYPQEIAKVLNKTSQYEWVVSLISSDLDVDRLDYLTRDSMYSGVIYGNNIDIDLFIKWAIIKDGKLAFLSKIKYGLDHFALSRKHMYEDLYGNGVNNIYEHLFIKVCAFVKENIDKCSKAVHYDICRFAFEKDPDEWTLEEFVALRDDILLRFVETALISNCQDEQVREFLGYLFGIWLNEKGEYIEPDREKTLVCDWDSDTRLKQLQKKGHAKIKINMWDQEKEVLTLVLVSL